MSFKQRASNVTGDIAEQRVEGLELSASVRMLMLSLKAIVASKVERNGIASLMVIVYPIMFPVSRKK
jgi:hypothetical protein